MNNYILLIILFFIFTQCFFCSAIEKHNISSLSQKGIIASQSLSQNYYTESILTEKQKKVHSKLASEIERLSNGI